jgi:hypothetical protein
MRVSEELAAIILAFDLAWATLLVAPVLALLAFVTVYKQFDSTWRWIKIGAISLIALAMIFKLLDLSFVSLMVNIAALGVLYFVYCFIAFSAWRIRLKWIRYSLLLVMMLPILYWGIVGTIMGPRWFGFILAIIMPQPAETEVVADGLVCKKTILGVLDYGGYEITIYRQYGPYIERRLASKSIYETKQAETTKGNNCQDVLLLIQQ